MSNGVLGKTISSANNHVNVYTVPAGMDFATVTIAMVNMATTDAKARVAMTPSPTPSAADYIEFDAVIPSKGGILERTCIVMSAGENLIVRVTNSETAIRVFGLEKLL